MRKPLMAGNWKMNKTISEAIDFTKALKSLVADVSDVEILICPAFTSLSAVYNEIKGGNIKLGAQNLFWENKGAFTGEVSPVMIKDSGCSYVLIGHSERRQYFGETDEKVNKKTKAAFSAGLIPIVCVGETLDEREKNETLKVIETQIKNGLAGLDAEQSRTVVIAYEPVWAIGTGKTATPEQAQEVHNFARKIYSQMYKDSAEKIRILYGGSVKPDNISTLMQKPDIDGGLVGGASLESDSFAKLVKYSK
ncbi:MAG: triose-phosphate isomerase [Elusimicrobiota bacterium]|jgi:triosephosphate isomerase|nr:triose-phosphate isomerase [Elusimicrobiota bacterium]